MLTFLKLVYYSGIKATLINIFTTTCRESKELNLKHTVVSMAAKIQWAGSCYKES